MIEFHLYDEPKEITLYDFCDVCKLPYERSVSEPRPRDVEEFIAKTTVGEERERGGCRKREWVAYIFLFYAITHYFLGDV